MEKFIFVIFIFLYSYILKDDYMLKSNPTMIVFIALCLASLSQVFLTFNLKTERVLNFVFFLLITILHLAVLIIFGVVGSVVFIFSFSVIYGVFLHRYIISKSKENKKHLHEIISSSLTDKKYEEALKKIEKIKNPYLNNNNQYILLSIYNLALSNPEKVIKSLCKLKIKKNYLEKFSIFSHIPNNDFLPNIYNYEIDDFDKIVSKLLNEEKAIIKAFYYLMLGERKKADKSYEKWSRYIRNLSLLEEEFFEIGVISDEYITGNQDVTKIFYSFLNGLFYFYLEEFELSRLYFQNVIDNPNSDEFYCYYAQKLIKSVILQKKFRK